MNTLPTAEEYWKKRSPVTLGVPYDIMIGFAKLHVQEALKAAAKQAKVSGGTATAKMVNGTIADKFSILSAYPLNNIK
jgi:hypothetical protein